MRGLIFLLTLLITQFPGSAWAQRRHQLTPEDHEERATLQAAAPELFQQLEHADRNFARGDYAAAEREYASIIEASPEPIGYPRRRRCQALTELGQREAAITACRDLLNTVVPSAADWEATVAALMLGEGKPSDNDLADARRFVARAEGADPESVWAAASRCAVARRLHDRAALSECAEQLARLAPDDALTRQFTAAQPAWHAALPWLKRGLLAALALAVTLTLLHRALGRRVAAPALALAFVLVSNPSSAQDFGIVEESANDSCVGPPTAEDQTAADETDAFRDEMKLVQGILDKVKAAEQHIETGDWKSAVAGYNEVVTTIPYFVKGWRRLCEGYSSLGMPVEGAHACRQVLASKEAGAWDRAMLVHHLLTGPDAGKPATLSESKNLAAEAIAQAPAERWGYDAQCEVALKTEDTAALHRCTQKLDELAPDDRKTLSLLWSLALKEQRLNDAELLIERAQRSGMDEPTLTRMRQTLQARSSVGRRLMTSAPWGLVAAALGTALFVSARRYSSRRRAAVPPAAS